eukprot:Lankesteria_metandrocarpae@DN6744_c0_g1_i1.p1
MVFCSASLVEAEEYRVASAGGDSDSDGAAVIHEDVKRGGAAVIHEDVKRGGAEEYDSEAPTAPSAVLEEERVVVQESEEQQTFSNSTTNDSNKSAVEVDVGSATTALTGKVVESEERSIPRVLQSSALLWTTLAICAVLLRTFLHPSIRGMGWNYREQALHGRSAVCVVPF